MCVLVIAMVIVGGATRLTHSGLSITQWKPITGALPPLNLEQWNAEFALYKRIPQFMADNPDMNLAEFKGIYFWEWTHRQLGRFIGLAFALPFFILLARKKLPRGRTLKLWSVLFLIGLQGAIGWWMVKSGLSGDATSVSQYRLAIHLGMAFIILGLLFTLFLDSLSGWPGGRKYRLRLRSLALLGLIYAQIIAGAFVAGTDGGKTYNTWPAMDGGFVPSGYLTMNPAWKNLFENIAAIQFNHRLLAYIILIAALALWLKARGDRQRKFTSRIAFWLMMSIIWQAGLGIWTLVSVAPLHLSLAHQASSIGVFLIAVWLTWTTCAVATR